MHVINIQGNKYGGSCAVNLGIHPLGMKMEGDTVITEPKSMRPYGCILNTRLSEPQKMDRWWKYKSLFRSPEKQAKSLMRYYQLYGEQYFRTFEDGLELLSAFDKNKIECNEQVEIARLRPNPIKWRTRCYT